MFRAIKSHPLRALTECKSKLGFPCRSAFKLKPGRSRSLTTTPKRMYGSSSSSSGRLLSPAFTVLLLGGLTAVSYGIYNLYATLTMWPPELRGDLRAGLRARHQGDYAAAEEHLRRAWARTKIGPGALFAPDAYLKISGVAICLADVLEHSGKINAAFDIYAEAAGCAPDSPSSHERMRVAAIAYRLGELARALHKPAEAEEKWLTMAVERVLQVVSGPQSDSEHPDAQSVVLELDLPAWVTKTNAAAPLEALGTFYADAGKPELAMPLYLHAAAILIPPPPQVSSTEDRCRGAQVMLSLSELIMRQAPTAQVRHQAEAWAGKGLEILLDAVERPREDGSMCEYALVAALFNMGVLREMAGDKGKARELYVLGVKQAKAVGMLEGVREGEDALRRLQNDGDGFRADEIAPV